jgi:hypothetical protein
MHTLHLILVLGVLGNIHHLHEVLLGKELCSNIFESIRKTLGSEEREGEERGRLNCVVVLLIAGFHVDSENRTLLDEVSLEVFLGSLGGNLILQN